MITYRETNKSCLNCGSQVPADIIVERWGRTKRFICPECGESVLNAIIVTDPENNIREGDVPPILCHRIDEMRAIGNFSRWELWWTNKMWLCLIHGRKVSGDEKLKKLIQGIKSIHDISA